MGFSLACAVLSFRDEPGLVEAVRSLATQDPKPEIVVVNSGGGDPAARLAAAGLDIPVVNRRDPLYPGAVRNLGVRHTEADYVSFLAADCLALPGWVAGRLREHRAGAAAVGARLTNAYSDRLSAWASLLLLHTRQIPAAIADETVIYGLSYERALFTRYGEFDEALRAGEDTEFNARFLGHERVVRAADVYTAHRYPRSIRAFLKDAHRRGRLQASMNGQIEGTGPQRRRVIVRAGLNVLAAPRLACGARPGDRARLLAAWPLIVMGAAVYGTGALTARENRYDGFRPPLADEAQA